VSGVTLSRRATTARGQFAAEKGLFRGEGGKFERLAGFSEFWSADCKEASPCPGRDADGAKEKPCNVRGGRDNQYLSIESEYYHGFERPGS
jgi:hypothetical protein